MSAKAIKLGLLVLAVLAAGGWYLTQNIWAMSSAQVTVGQGAVLVRNGDVVDVLEPGLHFFREPGEHVVIYDTRVERRHAVPAAFTVEDCAADIEMIFSVGDIVEFHDAGGDFASIANIDDQITAFAAGRTVLLDEPLGGVMADLHAHLRSAVTGGFQINRVSADLGECGPQPPRIAMEREAMPAPVVEGVLGAERTEPFSVELITSDDVRIGIVDAVGTYDVVDEALVQTCFGSDPIRPASQVEIMAHQGLRVAVGYASFAELDMALSAVNAGQGSRVEDFAMRCGIAAGAVDFSAATFTRLNVVNCDETPDAAVCLQ